jgi:uncharacterized membrane protein
MVNKFLFFLLAFIILIAIYLSLLELLLYSFHSPFNSTIQEPFSHQSTWIYLLKQQYMSFIELDTLNIHEKRHLLDVKKIFEKIHDLWLIFSFLTALIVVVFIAKLDTQRKTLLKYIYILGVTFNTLVMLLMFNFLTNFIFLHTLLFSKNTWNFSENSILIEWFPLIYFQEFIVLFLLLSFLIFFLLNFYRLNSYK